MTTQFQFDTSGMVLQPSEHYVDESRAVRWPDLSPFVQGYVEAMFAEFRNKGYEPTQPRFSYQYAFSDLASETLARIMEWTDAFQSEHADTLPRVDDGERRRLGEKVWNLGKHGFTPYLGDDGKVYLREVSQ